DGRGHGALKDSYFGRQLLRLGRTLQPEKFLDQLKLSPDSRSGNARSARLRLPHWNLTWGNLPSVGMPNLGGRGGDEPSSGAGVFGLLGTAAAAYLLWYLHHKRQQARAALRGTTANRAWPIAPSAIASRDDLIKAFEFLSLSKLGESARTWNHLDIA